MSQSTVSGRFARAFSIALGAGRRDLDVVPERLEQLRERLGRVGCAGTPGERKRASFRRQLLLEGKPAGRSAPWNASSRASLGRWMSTAQARDPEGRQHGNGRAPRVRRLDATDHATLSGAPAKA